MEAHRGHIRDRERDVLAVDGLPEHCRSISGTVLLFVPVGSFMAPADGTAVWETYSNALLFAAALGLLWPHIRAVFAGCKKGDRKSVV